MNVADKVVASVTTEWKWTVALPILHVYCIGSIECKRFLVVTATVLHRVPIKRAGVCLHFGWNASIVSATTCEVIARVVGDTLSNV